MEEEFYHQCISDLRKSLTLEMIASGRLQIEVKVLQKDFKKTKKMVYTDLGLWTSHRGWK